MHSLALYLIVFIASGSGFLTQTLISGFWTSAFSDDIINYSVHLSVFFLSLGLGALLADWIRNPKKAHLYFLGISICLWIGFVIPLLKCAIVLVGGRLVVPLVLLAVQGTLVGCVVPLALRVEKKRDEVTLGKLFFVDYISALVLSCIFTFFLLIPLGFTKTGLAASLVGLCAISVAWFIDERRVPKFGWVLVPVLCVLFITVKKSNALVSLKVEHERSSKVVLSRQSHYQKIVLMEEASNEPSIQGDRQYVLYLDGFLQFASVDEQTYHACIANVPMMAYFAYGKVPKNVLILGGGDGLAARNVLLVPGIEKITLVELDPTMIEIAKNHPIFREQNLDSLRSPRVEVVNEDAFRWVHQTDKRFDLVIIDFPLPKNLTLSRLYTAEFYRDVFKVMTEDGIVAIQAGPSFSYEDPTYQTLSKVTASILRSIESVGKKVWAYTSVLDNEAFAIASNSPHFDFEVTAKKNEMHEDKGFGRLCSYRGNWKRPSVEVNTLNRLPIAGYMMDWIHAGRTGFFHYRGTSANFLPE